MPNSLTLGLRGLNISLAGLSFKSSLISFWLNLSLKKSLSLKVIFFLRKKLLRFAAGISLYPAIKFQISRHIALLFLNIFLN